MSDSENTAFAKAHDLAERLYNMQRTQADHTLAVLTAHGDVLNTMAIDLAVVKADLSHALKLDAKIDKVDAKVEEIAGDLNKAKGGAILGGILLAISNFGVAIWAAWHGKS